MLHYSESSSTWGCIRINTDAQAQELGNIVKGYLNEGRKVMIDVKYNGVPIGNS